MTEHTCSYCGLTEGNPQKMDTSANYFCTNNNRTCFKKFYSEKKSEYLVINPPALGLQEVREHELTCRKLYGEDSPFNKLSPAEQDAILNDVQQKIAKLKMEELYIVTAKHRSKMQVTAQEVEQLRKFGVSEPRQVQKVLQTSVQKTIVSYYKSNMKDTLIINMLVMATGLTKQQAEDEINQCRKLNMIGDAK